MSKLDKKAGRRSRTQAPLPIENNSGGIFESEAVDPILTDNVDIISPEMIAGWAWNPLNPQEAVLVDIYDGSELLIRVRADIYRGDLRDAGFGTGKYGFAIPRPAALLPLARH